MPTHHAQLIVVRLYPHLDNQLPTLFTKKQEDSEEDQGVLQLTLTDILDRDQDI